MRVTLPFLISVLILIAPLHRASAAELEELYRSARMMGMGGTSVALATNEDALWLNPAGLADVRQIRFQPLSLDVHVANDLVGEYLAGKSCT